MISKAHRFHGYGSLNYIYRNGKTLRDPLFAVKYLSNERRKTYRLSVVVAKKVNKSAVARNRIRRVLYEAVRHYEPKILKPYDIVITVFSDNIMKLSMAEVDKLVKAKFQDAGIIEASNS